MLEKIIETVSVFYEKFAKIYLPGYFSWLENKLSGTEPFFVLWFSVGIVFVLFIYLWYRSQNS